MMKYAVCVKYKDFDGNIQERAQFSNNMRSAAMLFNNSCCHQETLEVRIEEQGKTIRRWVRT